MNFFIRDKKKDSPGIQKSKVVAIEELADLHPILQIVLVQNCQRGKELKQFCPPRSSDDLGLLFCTINPSMLPLG